MSSQLKCLSKILVLVSFLGLASCASNKKSGTEGGNDADAAAQDAASKAGSTDLYGDSDSSKAGTMKTVFFDFNSSGLSESSKATLDNNVAFMKSAKTAKVQVEGHADERGGIQYNLALGERRANSVKDYMVAAGIASDRLSVISYGKERPKAFGHDEAAWSQNRRGNFVIVEK
jgi:peptidoglycan-associated lipoprotein